jgi:hypothetical protein
VIQGSIEVRVAQFGDIAHIFELVRGVSGMNQFKNDVRAQFVGSEGEISCNFLLM